MYFKSRFDAAMQLVPELEKYKNQEGVILAVPRGGVPIGFFLAKELGIPLDLLMTKKLGHPYNPEYAIGAVNLEDSFIEDNVEVPEGYCENEILKIRKQLQERYKIFMNGKEPVELKNKTVIIVDDGIATGRTIIASIKMIRNKQPKKIVVAVPVSPIESAARMKNIVDEFICLYTPDEFYGVGAFYDDFSEVTDKDVMQYLNELNDRKKTAFH